jgi:hypothetical protein
MQENKENILKNEKRRIKGRACGNNFVKAK